MKRAIAFMTVFVAVAFLAASATIINIPDDYETIQEGIDATPLPEKARHPGPANVPDPNIILQGGDRCEDATVIPGIPYNVDGTTAGYNHDYDEVCGYNRPGAPDVVYLYTPEVDIGVTLSLCQGQTAYDTKMYVYEDVCQEPGDGQPPYACNDDYCTGDYPHVSYLEYVPLYAGHTYYIVIDGWSGGDYGPYNLDIVDYVPPTGACCDPVTADCVVMSVEDCETAEGIYQGDGTICDPNPCLLEEIVCIDALYESSPEGTAGLSCERRTDPEDLESWVVDDVVFGTDVTVTDLHFWCFHTDEGFDFRGIGDYIILEDDAGAPGAVVAEVLDAPLARFFTGRNRFDFESQPVYLFTFDGLMHELVAGTYWFGMRPLNYDNLAQNWWLEADPVIGSPVYFRSEYFGFPDWEIGCFDGCYDVAFCITGWEEPGECDYTPGDCNHNGNSLELEDVIAMIGMYRGSVMPPYECDCPPHGDNFTPTADPNGNCVALELGDVVTEIAAYRGTGTASGCPDCPGAGPPPPLLGQKGTSVVPSLKSKVKINQQGSADQ